MNILYNFIGTKENSIIPKLTSKKFKVFSKRKSFISLRIFSYNFFKDYFSFFYDLDNDFLRGRYIFKDRLKKKFCVDFEKNEKISRIIRPFGTYIFTIRKNKFYLMNDSKSKRKQERRFGFWLLYLKKNNEFFFNFYRDSKLIYNPNFLQVSSLLFNSDLVQSKKKDLIKTRSSLMKKEPKKFNFKFFQNFNK